MNNMNNIRVISELYSNRYNNMKEKEAYDKAYNHMISNIRKIYKGSGDELPMELNPLVLKIPKRISWYREELNKNWKMCKDIPDYIDCYVVLITFKIWNNYDRPDYTVLEIYGDGQYFPVIITPKDNIKYPDGVYNKISKVFSKRDISVLEKFISYNAAMIKQYVRDPYCDLYRRSLERSAVCGGRPPEDCYTYADYYL